MEKLLYTPQEVCDLLGIKRTKVYELLASGKIESVHIGSSRRVSRVALEEFVKRLQEERVA